MRFKLILSFVLLYSCVYAQSDTFRLAFGSCANQSHPLPIYDVVVKHKPNVFALLGDNVYADTKDYNAMVSIYNRMAEKPTYKNLKANVPIIATWDDHDYGENDAGKNFSAKDTSKRAFLNFIEEPESSPRWSRGGVYDSYYYTFNNKTIQVILLDVRWFRDDLKPYDGRKKWNPRYWYYKRYAPYEIDAKQTILGDEQWIWLEEELMKPADIRIIGSGSQFGNSWNGYESWANFPNEQQRLFNLIQKTKANGVLIMSGDVHYAELSKLTPKNLYPIYDLTASGLSSTWEFATPNKNRIEGPVMQNHFGMITLIDKETDCDIILEIWDVKDKRCIQKRISLSELKLENK